MAQHFSLDGKVFSRIVVANSEASFLWNALLVKIIDLSPMERTRTLSNKASQFDKQRLVGTKPEIKYRLKFVKKEGSESKNTENNTSETKQENGKYHSDIFTIARRTAGITVVYLSHLMRVWYFSSSLNSFFKRASKRARYLRFGQTFCLLPYFMCANSELSGENAQGSYIDERQSFT